MGRYWRLLVGAWSRERCVYEVRASSPCEVFTDDRLSTGPNTPVSTFYTGLKTYNASQIQSSFASTAFSCAICLEDRKGKGCIQMPGCGCVLYVSLVVTCPTLLTCSCVPCLSSGWTLAITEGSLENVFCPSVTCTKERAIKEDKTGDCGSTITASLIESVVGQGLRERWEWITENRKAETGGSWALEKLLSHSG
jgi:E3 ubiquitin-protein ligase RNF14